MVVSTLGRCLAGWGLACLLAGCAVGQKPGNGQVLHSVEPRTGAGYCVYLPEDYDSALEAGRHLPLVMTFHGMKPFDSAGAQIREWQQEADRYGYVVCAPKLSTPDVLSPLPLNTVTKSLRRDEERILAIMDELGRTTNIDPNAVLVTSWSYGGYLAHYMANRHPERFSCIAVKQSNFSADLLDPQMVPRYRDRKVGIFYTQNDFKICRVESRAAAHWYGRHGFDLTFAVFQDLGHERRPGVAASFFAHTCNAAPKTPPVELARMQVLELPTPRTASADLAASTAVRLPPLPKADGKRAETERQPSGTHTALANATPQAGSAEPPVNRSRPTPLRSQAVLPPSRQVRTTPRRTTITASPETTSAGPIRVRLSSTIGISPLLVSYSVAPLPPGLGKEAFLLWTDNGEPISNALNGQKLFSGPGTHRLEVLVTTSDGREYRAGETVTILKPVRRRGLSR